MYAPLYKWTEEARSSTKEWAEATKKQQSTAAGALGRLGHAYCYVDQHELAPADIMLGLGELKTIAGRELKAPADKSTWWHRAAEKAQRRVEEVLAPVEVARLDEGCDEEMMEQ